MEEGKGYDERVGPDEEEVEDMDGDADDELDIEKTKEGLWTLLTGQYSTVFRYESVFKFIEESMP